MVGREKKVRGREKEREVNKNMCKALIDIIGMEREKEREREKGRERERKRETHRERQRDRQRQRASSLSNA